MSAIPNVDLAPILGGDFGSAAARRVLEELHGACAGIGFVTVTGHDVPPALVDATAAAARAFFALEDDAKLAVAPQRWNPASPNAYRGYFPSSVNGKEGLDLGDPRLGPESADLLARPYYELNRLPDALPDAWRTTVADYFDALSSLAELLTRAVTTALGGDPDRVARAFARPGSLSTLRFNYYPSGGAPVEISQQDAEPLSCGTHVDSGFLTVLHQDRRAGLEVQDARGRWHAVPFDPRAFVVNTGLALQRASGEALVATNHRVLLCREERVSIPFFLEPVHDFIVGPESLGLPGAVSDTGAPTYERFLRESLAKFVEYDRDVAPSAAHDSPGERG